MAVTYIHGNITVINGNNTYVYFPKTTWKDVITKTDPTGTIATESLDTAITNIRRDITNLQSGTTLHVVTNAAIDAMIAGTWSSTGTYAD